MSLFQKIQIGILMGFVNIIAFVEKKFLDLIKGLSLASFNIVIFTLVLMNVSYFQYLFGGLLYANTSYVGDTVILPKDRKVLGYSTVSLVRTLSVPEISSKVALVMDKNTDTPLFDVNSDMTLASASTTKLMTALITLDIYNLNDVLEVPFFCTTGEGSKVGLSSGVSFTVDSLLKALLIQSGADAACVLSNSKVSYLEFVDLMNKKAKEIGMDNTSFTNPVGLDGVNGSHYSTAYDLYLLAKRATSNEIISSIVKTKNTTISSVDSAYTVSLGNTNKLLWEIPNTVGVKTGTTAAAGEVLIYEYLEEDKGIDLVIIVMDSSDRFYDTKSLLNWTLSSYTWNKK